MSPFPPELEHLIIGHMQGDKRALASCGLVSRSWLDFSRPYLFESVFILDHTYEDFLRLSVSPCSPFTPSVKTLCISRSSMDDVLFTELIHKLPGFPSLRCLRLLHIRWTSLPDILLTSFTAVFRDITQFDLDNATFATTHHLIDVLACLPRLERSTVYAVFLKNRAEPVRPSVVGPRLVSTLPWYSLLAVVVVVARAALRAALAPPPPPRKSPLPREPPHCLRELRLCLPCWDSFDPIISWIGTGPPTIHALKLGILPITSLPAVGNLLRILRSVLRDLELDFPSHITSLDIETHLAPHLARTTHITHLTIHSGFRSIHMLQHASWTLLDALPREPETLETLTIILKINSFTTILQALDMFDWANLNAALRARPRLRRLRFHLHWNNHRERLRFRWNNPTDEAVKEIRRRVAPEFMSRGIVDVLLLRNSGRHYC
ncbi:hypothetical protein GGX14DRAFT_634026 [Mycena pura]|uniref:F-box domain-containing protein n=1 Tax=Mycena pura TaxID=153505 RepID=A0AAD6VFI1_9AGAR|nr:hypothetical protein GGX14DRAFT_634026 [Mycena pura]